MAKMPDIGKGAMLVPVIGPVLHFVRWSPRERLAFLADGRSGIGICVEVTRERCPLCLAPVVNPTHGAVNDPARRYRSAATPVWCCLRNPNAGQDEAHAKGSLF